MIVLEQYETIRQKHGDYASWAVWAVASEKPKSNIGDMSVFDVEANPSLLSTLKPNVVMAGLNSSRSLAFDQPFRNFHDRNPRAQDFKIRYAFTGTPYYGAYMTDIIKNVEMGDSKDLLDHLKASPHLIEENVQAFRRELHDLNGGKPTILAFGVTAHRLIAESVPATEYARLVRLTHYSHQIGKEAYREMVLAQLVSRNAPDREGVVVQCERGATG